MQDIVTEIFVFYIFADPSINGYLWERIHPRATDVEFSEIESMDLPQSKNQKSASIYFFPGHTLFTTLLTGLCVNVKCREKK